MTKIINFVWKSESDASDESYSSHFVAEKLREFHKKKQRVLDSIEDYELNIALKRCGIKEDVETCSIEQLNIAYDWMKNPENEKYVKKRISSFSTKEDFERSHKTYGGRGEPKVYEFVRENIKITLLNEKAKEDVKIYDAPGVWGGVADSFYKGILEVPEDMIVSDFIGINELDKPFSEYLVKWGIDFIETVVPELESINTQGVMYEYQKDGQTRYTYEVSAFINGDVSYISIVFANENPKIESVIEKLRENER